MFFSASEEHSERKWLMYLSTNFRLSRFVKSNTTTQPWHPLKYYLVRAKNVSCPEVSQTYRRIAFASIYSVSDLSSMPTVANALSGLYTSSTNLINRLVLPQLGAPSRMTLKVLSKPWKRACGFGGIFADGCCFCSSFCDSSSIS